MDPDIRAIIVVAKKEFRSMLVSWRILVFGLVMLLAITGLAWGVVTLAESDPDFLGTGQDVDTPGEILAVTSTGFVYLGSLLAVAIGFDAITYEKVNGSMDLLLVRPGSKWAIAVGKYVGLLGAMALPLIISCVFALLLIGTLGEYPSLLACGAFIFFSLLFLSVFLLIELLLSTWIDSIGMATLGGISIWIIFVFFWLLIPASVAFLFGIDIAGDSLGTYSEDFGRFLDQFSVYNPILSYTNTIEVFTDSQYIEIPRWAPPIALLLWNNALLLLYPLAFERKFRG